MKVAAVIQTSSRDWEGNLDLSLKRIEGEPAISRVIERVKKIESIDDIIIAAPATEENAIFRKIAEKKDVKCFLGSESNVTERLLDAAQLTKADVIVRVLGQHFLLDHSLIQEMIGYLTSGNFDLVQPPEAFSIKYAAEIVRTEALKRARDEISNLVDAKDVAVFQSRPIAYFKCHPDRFRIGIYEKVPIYTRERRIADREAFTEIANEEYIEIEGKDNRLASSAVYRYAFICDFIEENDLVLDIACGTGYGSAILARNPSRVVGADISAIPLGQAKTSTSEVAERIDF